MSAMDREEKMIFSGVGLFFVLIVLCMIELVSGSWGAPQPAVIVDRGYRPSSLSIGGGMVDTGKGMQYVTTSHHESEKWIVMVRVGSRVESVETTPEQWADASPGKDVSVQISKSPILGIENGIRIR